MKYGRGRVFVTVLVLAGGCRSSENGTQRPHPSQELWTVLNPARIRMATHPVAEADPRVLVIGENHASVPSQLNLASLLDDLADKHLIDAILIEGSNGEIDAAHVKEGIAEGTNPPNEYWKGQVQDGALAGYEYVALTRPTMPVYGVEDMEAKATYATGFEPYAERSVHQRLERITDAAKLITDAAASLKGPEPALAAALSRDDAHIATDLASARGRGAKVVSLCRLAVDAEADAAVKAVRLHAVAVALQPELRAAQEAQSQLEGLRMAAKRGTLTRAMAEESDVEGKGELIRSVIEKLDELDKGRKEVDLLRKKSAAIVGKNLNQLVAFSKSEEQVKDDYFAAANRARTRLDELSGPQAAVVRPWVTRLDGLFAKVDEHDRPDEELRPRDKAMAANVSNYLQQHQQWRAALIVGYAHLPTVTEELRNQGLQLVSGGLVGNDSAEGWEARAWEARSSAPERVFSSSEETKEMSQLLSETWKEETVARLKLFQKLESSTTAPLSGSKDLKLVDEIGSADRVMYTGPQLVGPRINLGEQVVSRGRVPSRPMERYEVWDRKKARLLADELSDQNHQFIFAYQLHLDTTTEFRFWTKPVGGKTPKYQVLFSEPDTATENGFPVSPLWKSIVNADGAGGGGRLPPPRLGAAMFHPEPSGGGGGRIPPRGPGGHESPMQAIFGGNSARRSKVVRTMDPRRARANLDRLGKSPGLAAEHTTVITDPAALADVGFTTMNGDNTGLVVLIARNTPEFRLELARAADAQKIHGKQIALITCGDASAETIALRESLLEKGATMVWSPGRQITPETGARLADAVNEELKEARAAGRRFEDVEHLMRAARSKLEQGELPAGEIQRLRESGSWVLLLRKVREAMGA